MQADNFILDDYLKRIDFEGQAQVNITTLTKLMRCHLFSIPFENIDVQQHRFVSLKPEDVVNKIVYSNRGGYCYEVNGIFAMALAAIGFEYQFCGGRPMFYPHIWPKTHVVLVVSINSEKFVCDLGFGSFGIRAPVSLSQLNQTIEQDYDQFELSKLDQDIYLIKAKVENEWKNQFCFDLYPMQWVDMTLPNYFNSTHPDTIFVKKLLVVKHNPDGRSILLDNQLKRYVKGRVEMIEINREDIPAILKNEFAIDYPNPLPPKDSKNIK